MNGQYERFNSILISMIGTLAPEAEVHWQEQVATLVHVYNYTHSNANGFRLYILMYG